MKQERLFTMIRKEVLRLNNSYLQTGQFADIDNYIVPASLNDDQGIMGCIKLGLNELL